MNYVEKEYCIAVRRELPYKDQKKKRDVLQKSKEMTSDIKVGSYVMIHVHTFDQGPLDKKNSEAAVMKKENDVYQLSMQNTVISS